MRTPNIILKRFRAVVQLRTKRTPKHSILRKLARKRP